MPRIAPQRTEWNSTMPDTLIANQDQAAHWNERAGQTWAELSDPLDQVLAPFVPLLMAEIAPIEGGRILDVGCGSGAVTRASARLAGAGGSALGIDISAPLIAAARARSAGEERADFVEADAQTHRFAPHSFDAIVSRFGVMFFADPVAAFRNLHQAARRGATLACAAWRSAPENAFMTAAERAAAPFLPELPMRDEDAPGQFGFADGERVHHILAQAGWQAVAVRPSDVACAMSIEELKLYGARMGPLGALLPRLDEPTRAEVLRRVQEAMMPYVEDGVARFTAACWLIVARA
jgi:SAM-dependent methyltransferase